MAGFLLPTGKILNKIYIFLKFAIERNLLQPIGFVLLVIGIMIYNDMFIMPVIRKKFMKK